MQKIDENDLKQIKGGFGFWSIAGIVSLCVFFVGVVSGISNPVRCN